MHENSLSSWSALDRGMRAKSVLSVYQQSADPLTDREVMQWLGFTDCNQVRPRITELLRSGALQECGKMVDNTSRRKVRLCALKGRLCFRR